VNDAIRRGLAPQARPSARRRFQVRPHQATLRAGIDPGSINRLAGLEDESILRKASEVK